jgi:tetratricopeptide (TPR) repeat protein
MDTTKRPPPCTLKLFRWPLIYSFTGYYNLGAVRILQGKYSEAIPLLQRSLSIRPTADALSNLGTAYFQMQQYAESTANFEEAVKLDQKNYIKWGNRGDAYYWTPGRRPEASNAYGTAIALVEEDLRLNPHDAQLLSYIFGFLPRNAGRTKPALAILNASHRLQPRNPDLLLTAAITSQQLGETNRALVRSNRPSLWALRRRRFATHRTLISCMTIRDLSAQSAVLIKKRGGRYAFL